MNLEALSAAQVWIMESQQVQNCQCQWAHGQNCPTLKDNSFRVNSEVASLIAWKSVFKKKSFSQYLKFKKKLRKNYLLKTFFKSGSHMYNFRRIQNQNLAIGFNVTPNFDKSLLQNASSQSKYILWKWPCHKFFMELQCWVYRWFSTNLY